MRLSVLGLYQYDNSIFADMVIPPELDRETLIDNILLECAELEVLYPDADFFKFAVKLWSEKEAPRWNALYSTTQYKYDPTENYNRHETYTDTNSSEGTSSYNGKNSNEQKVSAYDSPEYKPSELSNISDENNSNSRATGKTEHTAHIHGNIGVTTTQEMIKQEREIILNIYDVIIEDFKNRFCILIY